MLNNLLTTIFKRRINYSPSWIRKRINYGGNYLFKYAIISVFIFCFINVYPQTMIDSLKQQLNKQTNNEEKVDLMLNIAEMLYNDTPTESESYCKQALSLAKKINYTLGIADAYNTLGICNQFLGKYVEAKEIYFLALKNYKELKNYRGVARCYLNIGSTYQYLGEYTKALSYFFKSLQLCEKYVKSTDQVLSNTWKTGVSKALNNIGIVYQNMQDYKTALEYFQKVLIIKNELKDGQGLGMTYNNIAAMHFHLNDYNMALDYFLKSMEIRKKLKDKRGLSMAYSNIAEVYIIQNKLDKALEYQQYALKIQDEIGEIYGMIYSMNGLASLYEKKGQNDKAIQYYFKGAELAQKIGAVKEQSDCYYALASVYAINNSFPDAYKYYKIYSELKDSLYNETTSKQITELQTRYETDKKEKEIILLKKDNQLHELNLNKQKLLRNFSIIGLALAMAIALLLYNRYRIKQRANSKLKSAYDKLKELEEFKELMTGMIVHDLKNPLNSIINLTGGGVTNNQNLRTVHQSGRQMLNMVMNILDVQKFEDAKVNLNQQEHLLEDIVSSAFQQISLVMEEKGLQVKFSIAAGLKVLCDRELTERVLVNLLTNAVKYTPASGEINIVSEHSLKEVKLCVADSGIGIPADKLNSVFEKFTQVEARHLGQTRSTGIGLTFCKLAVEAQGGKIWIESEASKGSKFYFALPLTGIAEAGGKVQVFETQTELTLTDEQRNCLQPLLNELRQLNVNDASEVLDCMRKHNLVTEDKTKEWTQRIEQTVYNCDEERFNKLLKM